MSKTESSAPASKPVETAPAENFTWAVKSDGRQSPVSTAAPSASNDGIAAFKGPTGYAAVNDNRNMIVQDADADDFESDVEIIDEGRKAKTSPRGMAAANGQEAPEAFEREDPALAAAKAKQLAAEEAAQIALSQRQQEEAAKLAEQRKRFDNQRYNQGAPGATTTTTTTNTTASMVSPGLGAPFSGPPGAFPASHGGQQYQSQYQSHHQNSVQEPLRTDMVMGLNLSTVPKAQDFLIEDCLPGGILSDTPRELLPSKVRNKHVFDDEDELLMKEILDESTDF